MYQLPIQKEQKLQIEALNVSLSSNFGITAANTFELGRMTVTINQTQTTGGNDNPTETYVVAGVGGFVIIVVAIIILICPFSS